MYQVITDIVSLSTPNDRMMTLPNLLLLFTHHGPPLTKCFVVFLCWWCTENSFSDLTMTIKRRLSSRHSPSYRMKPDIALGIGLNWDRFFALSHVARVSWLSLSGQILAQLPFVSGFQIISTSSSHMKRTTSGVESDVWCGCLAWSGWIWITCC